MTEIAKLATLESEQAAYEAISGVSVLVGGYADTYIPDFVYNYIPDFISEYTSQKLDDISAIPASLISYVLRILSNFFADFLSSMPILFAQLLAAIFFTYYLLIDGRRFVETARVLLPEKRTVSVFLKELDTIYNSLFNVYFLTSMLSGVLAAIAFLLIGVPYALLWGSVIAVFTLVPMLGPLSVIVPMSIYYIAIHEYETALFLLAMGIVVLTIIPENVIRPRLAMHGASIHPVITILAYTAPIFVIGISGVIVGPAVYGFILAAYRTGVAIRSNSEEPSTADAMASAENTGTEETAAKKTEIKETETEESATERTSAEQVAGDVSALEVVESERALDDSGPR